MNELFRGPATQHHKSPSLRRAPWAQAGIIAALCAAALTGCAHQVTPAPGGTAVSRADSASGVSAPKSTQAPAAQADVAAAGQAAPVAQTKSKSSTSSSPKSSSSASNSSASAGAPDSVPAESTGPADPKVGYATKAHGAPAVKRKGERAASAKVKAAESGFTSPATYGDGVTISTSDFSRGTVTSHGSGIITGAPFVVFTVTVQNGSAAALDLSSVVMTLRYGANETVAAPLYTDVPARDFSGPVAAGATATAVYAFQLPRSVSDGSLYVDINGTHTPAAFTGSIPK